MGKKKEELKNEIANIQEERQAEAGRFADLKDAVVDGSVAIAFFALSYSIAPRTPGKNGCATYAAGSARRARRSLTPRFWPRCGPSRM